MSDIGRVIRATVEDWGGADLPLERAVFGTTDSDGIANAVDAWCRAHLDSEIERYRFFDSSSGSVHGVHLRDGRDVVVKVHRPALPRAYLDAVYDVQTSLVASGGPGPRPLVAPVATPPGHMTAESMLGPFPKADAHDPEVRRALARGLAEFVRSGAGLGAPTALVHPSAVWDDALYPEPHSARFDFAATATGAAWIDELARAARTQLARAVEAPRVITHGDWRIDNVRVDNRRVVAIYDWDSVSAQPEVFGVASAALTFTVDWDRPVGEHFPTPPEVVAFVRAYESARGELFGEREQELLAGHMVASLAYGARCEHADPASLHDTPDSFAGLLRTLGPALLADGLPGLG